MFSFNKCDSLMLLNLSPFSFSLVDFFVVGNSNFVVRLWRLFSGWASNNGKTHGLASLSQIYCYVRKCVVCIQSRWFAPPYCTVKISMFLEAYICREHARRIYQKNLQQEFTRNYGKKQKTKGKFFNTTITSKTNLQRIWKKSR